MLLDHTFYPRDLSIPYLPIRLLLKICWKPPNQNLVALSQSSGMAYNYLCSSLHWERVPRNHDTLVLCFPRPTREVISDARKERVPRLHYKSTCPGTNIYVTIVFRKLCATGSEETEESTGNLYFILLIYFIEV